MFPFGCHWITGGREGAVFVSGRLRDGMGGRDGTNTVSLALWRLTTGGSASVRSSCVLLPVFPCWMTGGRVFASGAFVPLCLTGTGGRVAARIAAGFQTAIATGSGTIDRDVPTFSRRKTGGRMLVSPPPFETFSRTRTGGRVEPTASPGGMRRALFRTTGGGRTLARILVAELISETGESV